MPPQIDYRLPVSLVVVTGTRRTTRDALAESLGRPPVTETLEGAVVRVVTEADATRCSVTLPERRFLASFQGDFALAPDGRLTSASSTTIGGAGRVVGAIASLAGAAIGVVAHLGGADQPTLSQALGASSNAEAREFEKADPASSRLASDLAAARRSLRTALATHLAATANPGDTAARKARLAELETAARRAEAELTAIRAVYQVWRESKRRVTEQRLELRIALTDLTAQDPLIGATPTTPADPESTPVSGTDDLAARFGLGIYGVWPGTRRSDAQTPPTGDHVVVVRVPDLLELVVTRRDSSPDTATPPAILEISRTRHLVVDDHSAHKAYELERSLWGRRSVALTFDSDGLLAGVSLGGEGGAGAALEAAADIPSKIAGGVKDVTGLGEALRGARSAATEAELARVKRDVELRTARLQEAGLDATERDHALLDALGQRQSILEAQKAISDIDPSLVLTMPGQSFPQPTPSAPAPPPEQVIRVILEGATGPSPSTPNGSVALGGTTDPA